MRLEPRNPLSADGPAVERNSLLLALPHGEYERIAARLTRVPMRARHDLVEPNERIPYVYFPQSGMLSIVNDMHDRETSIEVGVIGREGMTGLWLFHGSSVQPLRILVQVAGEAKRMSAEGFTTLLEEDMPVLRSTLQLYTLAVLDQASQQAACNRLHSLEQRCAKWLLTTHDHMESAELPLTQELLSTMLGVRRPGVTVAAQALQDAGLISYRRGRIRIVDRIGLEKLACECYGRVRAEYERLLGPEMIPSAPETRGADAVRLA